MGKGEQTVDDAPSASAPPLPVGWAAVAAADGRVYYYCAATGETTWTFPTAPAPVAVPPPPGAPPPAGYPGAPPTQPAWSAAPPQQQREKPSTGKIILGTLLACCVADAIF